MNVFGYFFVNSYYTFMVIGIIMVVVYSIQNLSSLPMFADLFPKEKFGQFSSANAMVNCVLMIVANFKRLHQTEIALNRAGCKICWLSKVINMVL